MSAQVISEPDLGKRIQALRKVRGYLTQETFAAALASKGVTLHHTSLARVESGNRHLRSHELKAIAELLGVSADSLLDPSATFSVAVAVDSEGVA